MRTTRRGVVSPSFAKTSFLTSTKRVGASSTRVQTVLLESEEQFGRQGFFARAARASNLFCVLEHYLQPVHAQAGLEQRSTQLAVVAALVEKLVGDRIATSDSVSSCVGLEFDLALKQARSVVNAARVRERKLAS